MTQRAFRIYILVTDTHIDSCQEAWDRATPSGESRLWTLAQAIATSPIGGELPNASLVVRSDPTPMLALIGEFDEADDVRVQMLRWEIEHVLPTVRYISYMQAEKDCELLAAHLINHFERHELHRFRYVGIPRGGFIVLGMLAYTLGVPHCQLEAPNSGESDGAPVVIVDDCALTGKRFGEYLSKVAGNNVIFAHLYSHPALRHAIVSRERQVITCCSAHDLTDLAPERLGDGYEAWRKRWQTRDGDTVYWVGQPEHICFAWNEPEISLWNSIINREERGWQLIPPALCLKHRAAGSTAPIPIQRQPAAKGPLKPTCDVLFGEINGQVVAGNIQSGAVLCLTDVAADLWRAIVLYGNFDQAIAQLLREYDVEESILRDDVQSLLVELLDQEYLENDANTPRLPVTRRHDKWHC